MGAEGVQCDVIKRFVMFQFLFFSLSLSNTPGRRVRWLDETEQTKITS